MSMIIEATTPTITYSFNSVDPDDFVSAYLTIDMRGGTVLERDITTATIANSTISWTLTQEETLALDDEIVVQLNWKTDSGVRGASKRTRIRIAENQKDEVI